MRYVLKQKLLSWGDDYYIRDLDDGHEIYRVDGKAISWGGQLSVQDLDGNELAFIKEKLLKLSPTYEIYRNGELAAVVKQELFALLHHRFTVDVPGPNDLEARGDFLDHEYVFTRGEHEVARVSKRWLRLSDTYGVETVAGEDDVLILASAVVVDQVCHRDDGKRH